MKRSLPANVAIVSVLVVSVAIVPTVLADAPPAEGLTVTAVAFSPDGETLAIGDTLGRIGLRDVAAGTPISEWQDHEDTVTSITFLPDGARLVSGSLDGKLIIRELATGSILNVLEQHAPISSMSLFPDGHTLAVNGLDCRLVVWDLDTGFQEFSKSRYIGEMVIPCTVAVSADGKTLVTSGVTLDVRGKNGDTKRRYITGKGPAAFLPDSQRFAAVGVVPGKIEGKKANLRKEIRLWNVSERKAIQILSSPVPIFRIALSPDGKTIAAANEDGSLTLWDLEAGRSTKMLELQLSPIEHVPFPGGWGWPLTDHLAYSADGRLLAVGTAGGIELYDVAADSIRSIQVTGAEGVIAEAPPPPGPGIASAKLLDSEVATLRLEGVDWLLVGEKRIDTEQRDEVRLSPGLHRLTLGRTFGVSFLINPRMKEEWKADLEAELAAGRTYSLHGDRTHGRGYTTVFWIEDAETGAVVAGSKLEKRRVRDMEARRQDPERKLLIHEAAELGDLQAVKDRLSEGIAADAADPEGTTPLMLAAQNAHVEIVKLLLENGADPNATIDVEPHSTPLMFAAWGGDPETVRALVEQPDLDVNARTSYRRTALMFAAQRRNSEAVRVLLASPGIDVNAREEKGRTALDVAKGGSVRKLLVAAGARRGSELDESSKIAEGD